MSLDNFEFLFLSFNFYHASSTSPPSSTRIFERDTQFFFSFSDLDFFFMCSFSFSFANLTRLEVEIRERANSYFIYIVWY